MRKSACICWVVTSQGTMSIALRFPHKRQPGHKRTVLSDASRYPAGCVTLLNRARP
jgi:hypothetical protein